MKYGDVRSFFRSSGCNSIINGSNREDIFVNESYGELLFINGSYGEFSVMNGSNLEFEIFSPESELIGNISDSSEFSVRDDILVTSSFLTKIVSDFWKCLEDAQVE